MCTQFAKFHCQTKLMLCVKVQEALLNVYMICYCPSSRRHICVVCSDCAVAGVRVSKQTGSANYTALVLSCLAVIG